MPFDLEDVGVVEAELAQRRGEAEQVLVVGPAGAVAAANLLLELFFVYCNAYSSRILKSLLQAQLSELLDLFLTT